jgi:hypothetical protein
MRRYSRLVNWYGPGVQAGALTGVLNSRRTSFRSMMIGFLAMGLAHRTADEA